MRKCLLFNVMIKYNYFLRCISILHKSETMILRGFFSVVAIYIEQTFVFNPRNILFVLKSKHKHRTHFVRRNCNSIKCT